MNTPAHCGAIKPPKPDIYSEAPHPDNPPTEANPPPGTRVSDLLAAGVNVCLGADMMSDMHADMRAELHMQSLHTGYPATLAPSDVPQMFGSSPRFDELRMPATLAPSDVPQMATWRGAAAANAAAAGEPNRRPCRRHCLDAGPLAASGSAARSAACRGPQHPGADGVPCAGGRPPGGARRRFHGGGRARAHS